MMDVDDLYERVRRRRLYIYENGRKFNGTRPESESSNVPPEWYEPQTFKHAQELFDNFHSM